MSSTDPPPPPTQSPSTQPHLTPTFCFDTVAVRDFLRLSRASIDDSLSLHLNSLLAPSAAGFSPASTSSRAPPSSRRQIPSSACRDFTARILFPSWRAREAVLRYCAAVADDGAGEEAPAPPSTRTMRMPSDFKARDEDERDTRAEVGEGRMVSKDYWGRVQVVDERTDPYSARDYGFWREPRADVLKGVLSNEEGVERVVRSRTWGVLKERCLDDGSGAVGVGDWEEEWSKWLKERRL